MPSRQRRFSFKNRSASPTIGHGNGTSTDPRNPGYGALKILIVSRRVEF